MLRMPEIAPYSAIPNESRGRRVPEAAPNQRTEFQRVKPYSDRFGVTIGPLKALDF